MQEPLPFADTSLPTDLPTEGTQTSTALAPTTASAVSALAEEEFPSPTLSLSAEQTALLQRAASILTLGALRAVRAGVSQ